MAIHSSILAWRIPRTEEPGGLQPMGSKRVRRDRGTNTCLSFHGTELASAFFTLLRVRKSPCSSGCCYSMQVQVLIFYARPHDFSVLLGRATEEGLASFRPGFGSCKDRDPGRKSPDPSSRLFALRIPKGLIKSQKLGKGAVPGTE